MAAIYKNNKDHQKNLAYKYINNATIVLFYFLK